MTLSCWVLRLGEESSLEVGPAKVTFSPRLPAGDVPAGDGG